MALTHVCNLLSAFIVPEQAFQKSKLRPGWKKCSRAGSRFTRILQQFFLVPSIAFRNRAEVNYLFFTCSTLSSMKAIRAITKDILFARSPNRRDQYKLWVNVFVKLLLACSFLLLSASVGWKAVAKGFCSWHGKTPFLRILQDRSLTC